MDEEESQKEESSGMNLELGDIVELIAPTHSEYHQQVFYVNYISPVRIELLNVETYQLENLTLDESSMISDESITEIHLLSRSEDKGFARQKKLLPKTWIDIHFGGEVPTILTGEIMNLEEDEIEIKTFPDNDVLYIDFEYQGIPETIPIEKILIRDPPRAALLERLSEAEEGEVIEGEEGFLQEASIQNDEFYEYRIQIPEPSTPEDNFHEALQSVYLNANDLFGEDLEDIFQVVEIPESEKKYSLDVQVNDFTDELLSTIPNVKRTSSVMTKIHTLVERFKQLRELYSLFDENGNVLSKKVLGDMYKPIVPHLLNLDVKLRWLIPVVRQNKKVYDLEEDEENPKESEEITDGFLVKNKVELRKQSEQAQRYYKNTVVGEQNKYHYLLNADTEFMKPFDPPIRRDDFLVFNKEIQTDLEAIVNNLGDFYSTTLGQTSKKKYSKTQYVLQKYNLGESRVSLDKKGGFQRKREKSDKITIQSILFMPESVMKYSHVDLPNTNILTKSNLGQISLDYFRLFRPKKDIAQKIIMDVDKEIHYEKEPFLKEITEYILDESLNHTHDEDKYRQLLNVIFPKIRDLIRILKSSMENPFVFTDVVKSLEPFMIYADNISYGQMNEIRYFIKEKMKEYKIQMNEQSQAYTSFQNTRFPYPSVFNRILGSLSEKKEVQEIFFESYAVDETKSVHRTSSEILLRLIEQDHGQLYSNLLTFMLLSLITPNKLMDSLEQPVLEEWKSDLQKTSCPRRFLTKKYKSIGDLQKDNQGDVLYYDKEYDDTPYSILKKYDESKKTMLPEKFLPFLAENLIQKHNCPPDESMELAKTLVAGKKEVKTGEYAVVLFKPTLEKIQGRNVEDELTEKEKKQIEIEESARTYYHYYKRLSNHWVRDYDIDEEAFYDNNTLFCNIDFKCLKNPETNTCDATDFAEIRMKNATARKSVAEFDKRFSITVEEMTQQLESDINRHRSFIHKNAALQDNASYKSNFIAFEIGKYRNQDDSLVSPYIPLYDLILSQYDFPKKQNDLCKFVSYYCREPLYKEHDENPHWLYCKETNTPLVPQSLYQLAEVFVSGGDYLLKMDELCHTIGQLSDDGNCWTDKHCGCELRKIDFVSETGFDESGVQSFLEIGADALDLKKSERKVFEDNTTNVTYNVFHAMCSQMDIPLDVIEPFVLRVSMEMISNTDIVLEEKSYQRRIEKIEKTKGKAQAPYLIYKHQTILTIVGGLILVAVQSVIPSFRPKKTFPGCVLSFSGYPMGGVEDMTGLQYIACVMHKIKSSISPWDSIEKLNAATLEKRMREVLDRYVLSRNDIVELFVKKREYLILHPTETFVDKEHSISKWRHFLPPLVDFTLSKSVQSTSHEFDRDFVEQIRKGSKDQHTSICVYKSKANLFGYAVIGAINDMVKTKGLLLKTTAKVPFLENACCNEGEWTHPVTYFIQEDKNIDVNIQRCRKNEAILQNVRALTQAGLFYYDDNTAIHMPDIPTEFTTSNIYQAFIHYGHFDVESPIPEDVAVICRDKPTGYDPASSLEEKIEFLKKNGKKYSMGDLHALLKVVQQRNRFDLESSRHTPLHPSVLFREYVEHLESKQSTMVEEPLRKILLDVLNEYQPKVLFNEADREPTPFYLATTRLRNYLIKTNDLMYQEIIRFVDLHGNLPNKKFDEIQTVLLGITQWNFEPGNDSLFTITQFIQNGILSMTKIYPPLILHNVENLTVHSHWGLSVQHERDIVAFVSLHTKELNKYKNNNIVARLLQNISTWEEDINGFLKYLPVNSTMEKAGIQFFDLFDKRTLFLLYTYCWYSVLYQIMDSSHDEELIKMDITEKKNARRETIRASMDESNTLESTVNNNDDLTEYEDDMLNVEITSGEKEELQKMTCSLMLDFIAMENRNKKAIDFPYAHIAKRIHKTKESEKKSITDFLQNMDKDERNIESMLRKYKMGRWNVGMQKGLSQYDQKIYDENRDTNIARLYDEFAESSEWENAEPVSLDVADLDLADEREQAELYDAEGMDISGLGEEYGDGNVYEEDVDRDFGYDD